jgi:hypothetical protein
MLRYFWLKGAFEVGPTLAFRRQTPTKMDVYIDSNGYQRFQDSHKLVHRWMAEKKLNRKLRDGEVVHHIDRNKLNNYPENLYICRNQYHHYMLHVIDARKYGWNISWNGFQNVARVNF